MAAGLVFAWFMTDDARAQEEPEEASEAPSGPKRALAVGAAVVPGALVHGSGSYVLGRSETAEALLWTELGGIGLIGTGGYALFATGAARNLVGVAATGLVAGFGLFGISWLADLHAVTAPEGGWGRAARMAPIWEAEVGYRYVYDPRFDYRHFSVTGASWWLGRWRFSPSFWAEPDAINSRLRMVVAHRLLGPSRAVRGEDGSLLEIRLAGTEHRFPRERFTLGTAEWMVSGRLDLQRLGPHLQGSFAELGVGVGFQTTRFGLREVESMMESLLLSRIAFGIYVGDQRSSGGEWSVYYDHRHDGFAAGMQMPGPGAGTIGHLGLQGHHYFDERWGVGADFRLGSAYVLGASARFRHWGAP